VVAKSSLDLRPRYFEIFEFVHGLADGKTHSLKECGERFGISDERARQIEARMLYELENFTSDNRN
jgi:DNA-directed RNA polymerase sigma subunit (sigma70/sigma32)